MNLHCFLFYCIIGVYKTKAHFFNDCRNNMQPLIFFLVFSDKQLNYEKNNLHYLHECYRIAHIMCTFVKSMHTGQ